MVDRRSFLKSSATGTAAASLALAAPAIAQDKELVKMVSTWPRGFPGLGKGAQRIADRITHASGGRIEVRLFAAGELVPALDCFDAVSTGAVEMYHAAEYYWQGRHKGFNFFTGVPMGLTAQEQSGWIHFGGGQELWDELSAGFGIKCFPAGNTGAQMGGWFRKPILSIADLKDVTMRIPGLGAEVLRAVGAKAIELPPGEIFPALQAGTINAAEWVGPYNDMAFGIQQILKTYMYPAFHEAGSALSLGINKAWWDRQTPADQVMIRACCDAETDVMLAEYAARNGDSLLRLIDEYAVDVREFPTAVYAELAKASEDVVASVAQTDDLGARIHASYSQFRAVVAPWSRLSEGSYMRARHAALGI